MCRLYALHANQPTRIDCNLVEAQTAALGTKEKGDRPDGWGIAYYQGEVPTLVLDAKSCFHSPHFHEKEKFVYSKTIVTDIRRSQVGLNCPLNTQPFSYDQWTFAHNGTIKNFQKFESEMERRIERRLLDARLGSTDSELFFLWIATFLKESGVFESLEPDATIVRQSIADAMSELNDLCSQHGAPSPNLSFVLTDGNLLFACRWNGSLFYCERREAHWCSICGESHVKGSPNESYRAVVVSTQPMSGDTWNEVPKQGLLSVDADGYARVTLMEADQFSEVEQ